MKYRLTLELDVADSRRSPADTEARARRAAEQISTYAVRLRHVRKVRADLDRLPGGPGAMVDNAAYTDYPPDSDGPRDGDPARDVGAS